jgi:hypothetical protein
VLSALLCGATSAFTKDDADAQAVVAKLGDAAGLVRVKELLAATPAGARFRLDGLALAADGKSVKVSGVMLVPGASDEDRAVSAKQTREQVTAAIQKASGSTKFEGLTFDATPGSGSIQKVRGERLPHLLLQKAANVAGEKNPAVDEIKLNDARFDAAGRLVLIGVRGEKSETQKWLAEAIPTVLTDNAAAIGPNGKLLDAGGKSWVLTDQVQVFNAGQQGWPVSATAVQHALIEKKLPALARLRVDRLYFVSTPARVDELNPTGVNWEYALSGIAIGTEAPDARAIARFCDEFFAAAKWGRMNSGNLEGLTKADYRVPDPARKLQKAIAAEPALDGVRLDAGAEFDAAGRLLLAGLQPGLDDKAQKALAESIARMLERLAAGSDGNPLYRRLSVRGVSTEKLKRSRIRDLYAELRKAAAAGLDDVRLTRFYFDEDGRIVLLCDSPPGDEGKRSQEAVIAELQARLRAFELPAEPAPIVKAGPDPLTASLTKHLQTLVADPGNQRWTNVLIERGFFNEKNQYAVRGVVDSVEQKNALIREIEALKTDPQWAAYFLAPASTAELDVISMADLVSRVQRVTPAYPVFDGVRITGAKYALVADDANGAGGLNLVFGAQSVGKPNLNECRIQLARLIAEHPEYSRRLAKAASERSPRLRIEATPLAIPPTENFVQYAAGFAADYLGRAENASFLHRWYELGKANQLIDLGLMLNPDESALWFLSAYLHWTIGDAELTRRDLYRTIAIEEPLQFNGGEQRRRRYEAARNFQGAKRDELEKLWQKCFEEIKHGAKPITMTPGK